MKVIFKLFLVLFVFSFCACSSDDDSNNDDNEVTFEGIWRLTAISVESSFDFNDDGIASRNLLEETPCYNIDFINFSVDGTVNIVSGLAYISIEILSPTEYRHIYECVEGLDIESTWTKEGNIITVENGSSDFEGVIIENTLTVTLREIFEIEMYDGMNYSYPEEDVVLVYTKQ